MSVNFEIKINSFASLKKSCKKYILFRAYNNITFVYSIVVLDHKFVQNCSISCEFGIFFEFTRIYAIRDCLLFVFPKIVSLEQNCIHEFASSFVLMILIFGKKTIANRNNSCKLEKYPKFERIISNSHEFVRNRAISG
jgi:hypothetical protein